MNKGICESIDVGTLFGLEHKECCLGRQDLLFDPV